MSAVHDVTYVSDVTLCVRCRAVCSRLDLNLELPQGQSGSVGSSVAAAEQVERCTLGYISYRGILIHLLYMVIHRAGRPIHTHIYIY